MTAVSTRSFYIEQVRHVTVVCFTVSTMVDPNYEFVSDELFDLVEHLVTNGPIQVVLDLGSVHKIDDWGLAMLRAFHETIESHGGTTILCRTQHSIATAISIPGLRECFHVRETRSEAIRAF